MVNERIEWFRSLNFGLFVHWGPYSVLGRGEWVIQDERIPLEEYDDVTRRFTADQYNPREWVELAKDAGMKYLVLTSCHGDGYCLFDTPTYDRNSRLMTPGRDLVLEFVEACREGKMGVGLYYSLSNWYENRRRFQGYQCFTNPLEKPEWRNAWNELVDMKHEQVRELLTKYKPDILWLDDPPNDPESFRADELYAMIHELHPNCLWALNHHQSELGDFVITEERFLEKKVSYPWELCMPLSERWGYHRGDNNYKSVYDCLRLLCRCVLNGGNYLCNTGPYENGKMQPVQEKILRGIGEWISKQGMSLIGARQLPTEHAEWGELTTFDGERMYIHVSRWMGPEFTFSGLRNQVKSAILISTDQTVEFTQSEPARLTFHSLPEDPPDPYCNIIALEVEGEPDIMPTLRF